MSGEQLDALHDASMKILTAVGVDVHHPECRAMLRKAGAQVEGDLRVRIPPALVEQAVATAPSRVDIHDRLGGLAMRLEGDNSYFGTGSDLKFTLDFETGRRRESLIRDVELSARLCDKLANIDFFMSNALPDDVPHGSYAELEQLRVMLSCTAKPVIMTSYSGTESLAGMHEMALESCGGEECFRRSPNYLLYTQYVSPLQQQSEALEQLLFCADNRVPIIYMSALMMGASSPVTLAGTLALSNAECLAGLVMHQLRSPGAPFVYGGNNGVLDMKTTVFSYGAPEWRISDLVVPQLAARYGLPNFATAGATDAKVVDAQAGAEWACSISLDMLSGSNLIHDAGYLESGLTGSLESLVLCDEIISMARWIAQGFTIDEDTLALGLIERVGPGGHFLGEPHTVQRYRKDVWYPTLFDRDSFQNWREAGEKDVRRRARDRVRELLGEHL